MDPFLKIWLVACWGLMPASAKWLITLSLNDKHIPTASSSAEPSFWPLVAWVECNRRPERAESPWRRRGGAPVWTPPSPCTSRDCSSTLSWAAWRALSEWGQPYIIIIMISSFLSLSFHDHSWLYRKECLTQGESLTSLGTSSNDLYFPRIKFLSSSMSSSVSDSFSFWFLLSSILASDLTAWRCSSQY